MKTTDDTIMANYPTGTSTVTYTPPTNTVPYWFVHPSTCSHCNCTPCCCVVSVSSVWPVTSPPDKVRLSPAELDTLRKAAAKDDDLRAVLQKLRGKIEVAVDFEP